MAETQTIVAGETQQRRVAVVTGANKGIGLEIVRQLLDSGGDITVVLTSRDERRGLEAVEKLKQQQQLLPAAGAAASLEFHRLDVADVGSVAELADFIKARFGKLDILVNNAGVFGFALDPNHLVISPASAASSSLTSSETKELIQKAVAASPVAASPAATLDGVREAIDVNLYGGKRAPEGLLPFLRLSSSNVVDASTIAATLQFESEMEKVYRAVAASPAATLAGAREAIDINFYGTKRTTEALLPLLRLSSSPRIVNVTSISGNLQLISNESIRGELNDVDRLTEDRLDELLMEFLADFGDGKLEEKGWPSYTPAYCVSKAAMNAYTRKLAGSEQGVAVNCVHPGLVRTDFIGGLGNLSTGEGAANVVRVALLPHGGPSGLYYNMSQVWSF